MVIYRFIVSCSELYFDFEREVFFVDVIQRERVSPDVPPGPWPWDVTRREKNWQMLAGPHKTRLIQLGALPKSVFLEQELPPNRHLLSSSIVDG